MLFNRRNAVLALAGMLATAVHGGSPATAQIVAATSTELLMFDQAGCSYCLRWRAEVGPGYSKSPEGRRAPLRVVNIHGTRPEGIVLTSPIRLTPTFVLVENGREVGRISGYGGADFFWGMLGDLMKKLKGNAASA